MGRIRLIRPDDLEPSIIIDGMEDDELELVKILFDDYQIYHEPEDEV